MNIGLCGFGVVGRGVYEIVRQRPDMKVKKILCLEDIQLPDAQTVKDFSEILNDPEIDTVVEAMGGLHPSYDFARAALEAGKNVVSSNKAMVCTFYDQLVPLAVQKGVSLRCTAAVGGGIGWLSELERARRVQTINQVGGIMNGTCNYILDNMTRLGLGYDEALKQAQKISRKAASAGFEWETVDDVWAKVDEEVAELKAAYAAAPKSSNGKVDAAADPAAAAAVELEMGDVLFSLVNVARKMGVQAEEALRATCGKFRTRWAFMEGAAAGQGRRVEDLSMEEMEELWQLSKVLES